MPERPPFVVRVVRGDITTVRASVIVVNHVNELALDGAVGAVDRALGGAIARRAARRALNARFGTTFFLPAHTAPLPSDSVLVVSLGEIELLNADRLPELGAAIVEALATFRIRDAATILHGAGSLGLPRRATAARFMRGVLDALDAVAGADELRELQIVEHSPRGVPQIARGIRDAVTDGGRQVFVAVEQVGDIAAPVAAPPPTPPAGNVPAHLRVGITRASADLKVTVIGHGALDISATHAFPAEVVDRMSSRVLGALQEPSAKRRAALFEGIGGQLWKLLLGWRELGLEDQIARSPDGLVVFRLDDATVDLPWELTRVGGEFLAHGKAFARQLEIASYGRQAPLEPRVGPLRVLLVGDPTGDLPAARREARVVGAMLRRRRRAVHVTQLQGRVTYAAVSAALDSERYDVLHYAGHARFDPDRPGVSGLLLADGILVAEDLRTRTHVPRLLFANGCNSAQTGSPFDGSEATLGMVPGVLAAGVDAFIGSTWAVDDTAAATFATAFYRELLGGAGVGQAVQLARCAVIEAHGLGEPAWAGYALYGSPWKPLR